MMFLDCPAYLDDKGAIRCGLPAEVRSRYTVRSSDGPLESAMIRCPVGHVFNGPIEFLTWEKHESKHAPANGRVAAMTGHDRGTGGRDRRDSSGAPAVRDIPGPPARKASRPSTL
jgi:hypothetical protein